MAKSLKRIAKRIKGSAFKDFKGILVEACRFSCEIWLISNFTEFGIKQAYGIFSIY